METVSLGVEATEVQRAEDTRGHRAKSQQDPLETQLFTAWQVSHLRGPHCRLALGESVAGFLPAWLHKTPWAMCF